MVDLLDSHFHPENRQALRDWLSTSAKSELPTCWIIIYKKNSKLKNVSYEDVVEEAICFGMIDTQIKSVYSESYAICLRKRKNGSNWTITNTEIAETMIRNKKMTKAGQIVFENRKS